MSFKISTGLRNGLLITGSLRSLLNGKVLRLYGGAVPADADASLGSATLLCTVSLNSTGTGVTFEAAPVGGALVKTASEVWSGVNAASGTATFYRFVDSGDVGDASTTAVRAQGEFGGADGILSNPMLTSGATQTIDYAQVLLPLVG